MNSSIELDPMAELNELDDLGNLFEFGDIDLNTMGDAGQYGDHLQQQHGTHPSTPFQELADTPPMPQTSAQDFGGHEQFGVAQNIDQRHYVSQHKHRAPTSHPYTSEPMYQPSMQQMHNPYGQNFQFQPQSGFPSHHHVPPTPNSYEMHGETGRFMQQHAQLDPQQRAILEQRYHVRKDDAIAFTPMVSPAGTPQYSMLPEYTTPGAYFSPLTSPMLHAQNQQQAQLQLQQQQQQQQQGYHTNPSTAPNSNTISPIDPNLDIEMLDGMTLPESAGPRPTRRSRRKNATPKTTGPSARTKQSSTHNPQKRKSLPLSSGVPHTAPEPFLQRSITSQPSATGLQLPPQFDSSEGGSISPEPLNEGAMGPPPRPGSSLNHSPALVGQQQQQQNSGAPAVGAAATPKSLLTIRGNQQSSNGQQDDPSQAWSGSDGLDDLSLPEAAAGQQSRRKPNLTQINTQLAPDDNNTPRMSARKTPKLGPLSTPASSVRPSSAVDSPSVAESPMTASTPSAILSDRKDGKGGRGRHKRGSMSASSSKLVSPALVPKISPSIKPLLPEGTPLNTATQAMLLASKSNYQNLLEGNHLPGVTYPDSLSTGLSSKRTSHKVAEQGRRNRINEALKEMQSLIPKSSSSTNTTASRSPNHEAEGDASAEPGDDDNRTPAVDAMNLKEDPTSKGNSSKAATVELANEYIKKMQKDQAAQNADLLQLRLENEELRKRLGEQSVGRSPADESSERGEGDGTDSVSASSQGSGK